MLLHYSDTGFSVIMYVIKLTVWQDLTFRGLHSFFCFENFKGLKMDFFQLPGQQKINVGADIQAYLFVAVWLYRAKNK